MIFVSSYIYFGEDVRATLVDLPVYIGSVPTEVLEDFKTLFEKSLQRITEIGLDMSRMQMIIKREKRQVCKTPEIDSSIR